MNSKIQPTGREVFFNDDDIIVSKTDTKGRITYVNDVFLQVAGYTEDELLGKAHSIIRHPAMPRCVFQLLWDTISSGSEIFAYVVNQAQNGDHYWVFAHVTPSYDSRGTICSYHSSRRVPARSAVDAISPIYELLCKEEAKHTTRREGIIAATGMLLAYLEQSKLQYDEFVFSLETQPSVQND